MKKLLSIPIVLLVVSVVSLINFGSSMEARRPLLAEAEGSQQTISLGVNLIFPATHFVAAV